MLDHFGVHHARGREFCIGRGCNRLISTGDLILLVLSILCMLSIVSCIFWMVREIHTQKQRFAGIALNPDPVRQMKRKVGRKKDVLSRSSFYGRYKESVLQIHHSCSIANETSEIAGPISGVGQHVPSYCGACLKGRRLVTSLGPILSKCLAVILQNHIFFR